MGTPLLAEKRLSERRRLTGLMPGKVVSSQEKLIDCRPVDISEHGLGIISNTELSVGSIIILETHDNAIRLEVIWQQPDFSKRDLHRYGLVTKDQKANLLKIFSEAGCLR